MKRLLMLALVTGAAFAPSASACTIDTCVPSIGVGCIPCLVKTPSTRCKVDVGRCDGSCTVNVGYCSSTGQCKVNVGYCTDNTPVRV